MPTCTHARAKSLSDLRKDRPTALSREARALANSIDCCLLAFEQQRSQCRRELHLALLLGALLLDGVGHRLQLREQLLALWVEDLDVDRARRREARSPPLGAIAAAVAGQGGVGAGAESVGRGARVARFTRVRRASFVR